MDQQIVKSEPIILAGQDWEPYYMLPCVASLEIPVPDFTVGDLLRLQRGTIIETSSPAAGDVPLRVNKSLVAWTEFELQGDRLAVRITELI